MTKIVFFLFLLLPIVSSADQTRPASIKKDIERFVKGCQEFQSADVYADNNRANFVWDSAVDTCFPSTLCTVPRKNLT